MPDAKFIGSALDNVVRVPKQLLEDKSAGNPTDSITEDKTIFGDDSKALDFESEMISSTNEIPLRDIPTHPFKHIKKEQEAGGEYYIN